MSSQCRRSSGAGFVSPRAIVSGILVTRLQSRWSIQPLKMHIIQFFTVAGLRTVYLLHPLAVPNSWQLITLAFLLILILLNTGHGREATSSSF